MSKKVNPLAEKREITIENTIGPNQEVITITYRKGMTAGDVLIDLDINKEDYILADLERSFAPGDIIPPTTELILMPGSIGGLGSTETRVNRPNRIERSEVLPNTLNNIQEQTGYSQDQLKDIKSKYFKEALEIFEKDPKLRKLSQKFFKENLFDTLIEYYVEKELKYQEWIEFLHGEGNERFMSRYKNKYPRVKTAQVKWDSQAKIVQRLCWAIVFDCRHPLSGEKLTLREWLSSDLHHWDTTDGHENKYPCRIIDLIPLLRKSTDSALGHASITQLIKNGDDIKWENTFREIISSVLINNEAPKIWANKYKSTFDSYIRNNQEVIQLITLFISHFDSNYLNNLGFNL